MSMTLYEFPNVNTRLEGTIVIKAGVKPLYFPRDYMEDWEGGNMDEDEAMSADDGRIGENDAEVIEDWLSEWEPDEVPDN